MRQHAIISNIQTLDCANACVRIPTERQSTMKTYQGSCHCEAVVFEIETQFTEFTKCNCSLCTKKNAVMTKVHERQFKLLKGANSLGSYQWNMRIAKHHFCKDCGIYVFHRKRVTPDYFGVNVYCLNDVDISNVPILEVDGVSMTTDKNA